MSQVGAMDGMDRMDEMDGMDGREWLGAQRSFLSMPSILTLLRFGAIQNKTRGPRRCRGPRTLVRTPFVQREFRRT